jgi:hypothetical protein
LGDTRLRLGWEYNRGERTIIVYLRSSGGREEMRMKKSRKLVMVLLVAMVMTLSVATTAHADVGDAVDDWTAYLCYYFEAC